MKIKAQIEILEIKEEPVLTTTVEVDSIEEEVARIGSHLDPERKYHIIVKPDLPDLNSLLIYSAVPSVSKDKIKPGTKFPPLLNSRFDCQGQFHSIPINIGVATPIPRELLEILKNHPED